MTDRDTDRDKEKERQRERHRQKQRKTETDRQTDRQTDRLVIGNWILTSRQPAPQGHLSATGRKRAGERQIRTQRD